jgi:hypothetical protein
MEPGYPNLRRSEAARGGSVRVQRRVRRGPSEVEMRRRIGTHSASSNRAAHLKPLSVGRSEVPKHPGGELEMERWSDLQEGRAMSAREVGSKPAEATLLNIRLTMEISGGAA